MGEQEKTEEEDQKCLRNTKDLDRVGGLLEKWKTLRQEQTGKDNKQARHNTILHDASDR